MSPYPRPFRVARRGLLVVGVLIIATATPLAVCRNRVASPMAFPDGKRFAFTIVDDTDMATLERLQPIYDILDRYGIRTTKTVWVRETSDAKNSTNQGDSLRDPAYRAFILDLQRKGFEIALHGIRGGSSRRDEILGGLEEFKAILGHYPRMQVNHSLNRDNLYWGRHLYALAPFRWAASLRIPFDFDGHDPASEYFWGDVAQQHIDYVRRFTYEEINVRAVVPAMPYRLANTPYVKYWFPTADGDRIIEFDELLKTENLDRLEREGGVCLVYAHLGAGSFNLKDGRKGADPRFEARIAAVAARNGWFAPASTILDRLRQQPDWTGTMNVWDNLWLDGKFVAGQFGLR